MKESLQEMLERPDFLGKYELWRSEERDSEVFTDVYSGEIWKEFLQPGVPFLSVPNNFALQLNVDWFKLFKHTQHSEGAIYLTNEFTPKGTLFARKCHPCWSYTRAF